jgi:hypothetical protein
VQNELTAWHSSISLPLDCTLKNFVSPKKSQQIVPNCWHVDINVQHDSTKRAHSMAHLNFTAIRLLHETHDKTQHKHDKNKHNNATMNCNKTAAQIANDQRHQRKTTATRTTSPTMTTENTNAGSTQK